MKFVATVIPLVEFDNAPWSYSMSIDHIISGIYNSRIREVILIGDNTTLLVTNISYWEVYMQWIVGHEPKLCFIIIYIVY